MAGNKNILFFLLFIIVSFIVGNLISLEKISQITDSLIVISNRNRYQAYALYLLGYVALTVILSPRIILTIIGGILFGLELGFILAIFASTISAAIGFSISRYLAFEWIEKKYGHKILKIHQEIKERGWVYIAISRLIPILPFTLLNYAFGTTKIKIRVFLVVSAIFMSPALLFYSYIGSKGYVLSGYFLSLQ